MSHKTWDLTINNYSEADIDLLQSWSDEVTSMVIAKEIGEKGTPHLQGRITFKRTYRLGALKKLHKTAHWEPTKASQDNLYCMKQDSDVIININNKQQGKRTDLDKVVEAIENGVPLNDIYKQHKKTMIRYHKGVEHVYKKTKPNHAIPRFKLSDFPWQPITDWSKSHILWGPAGVGKTEFAKAHFERPLLVSHKDDLRLFEPDYHDGVVFDDMDFHHWPRTVQIHIVDIDEDRSIDVKYGTASIPSNTKKIFTTNTYKGDILLIEDPAIRRRVTVTEVGER